MEVTAALVPSVQEIAKEALTKVPERYVRPHHERPILSTTTTPSLQVPVIDLSKLLSQDLREPELKQLHYACKDWGFFQLINHGVSTSLLENVKAGAQEFFNLPMEEKKKFGQKEGDVEGYGQAFVVSDEQKLDWADMFFMFTLPPHKRKPHLLPSIPLPFRGDLETYSEQLRSLAIQILDLMANSLAIDHMEIREILGEAEQSMRMNYYPPCPQPELVIGLNSHSDGGGLTILLQANEVEVNSEKERLSIATFYNPAIDAVIGPAPSLVTPKTPQVFKRISAGDYFKGYLAQELRGKSFLDSIRICAENEKSS
ncbi:Oxoglutarate/iron-dependent dioxygenase [Sesbania bispinosa]|nr:Oxoglutarate/iron-dependent dioxygenase [Sesbania bispinosa]